ncbi:hypothetical protein MKW92_023059 [Papaver armeniacum]|nr:hypothetical protein MKW92_023059 [Papaver armeniacum]
MEGGGTGSVALPLKKNNIESALTQLQTKWRELEKGFQGWVSELPLLETVVVTATYALHGAAAGYIYGTLAKSEAANNFFPFKEFGKTRSVIVRNFSVLRGTDGAMICAMRRIRGGKDDTKARVVAAFTSGYVFQTLIRNQFSPSAPDAIAVGLVFALGQGLLHEVQTQLRSDSSQPPVEDTCYTRTRSMLSILGLQNYESNFKKNLLTDKTMPLLKESDLVQAEIPLGPRVLILNHIERDADLLKMREAENCRGLKAE